MQYIDSFHIKLDDTERMKVGKVLFLVDKRFQTLMSIPYFQSSIKVLIKNPKVTFQSGSSEEFYGTKKDLVDECIRYTDGSIEYPLEEREKTVKQANINAEQYVGGEIYQIEGYNSFSENYSTLLAGLIDYLQENKVEVIIYLPPYHPYVYEYIEKNTNYKSVMEAEKYILNYK